MLHQSLHIGVGQMAYREGGRDVSEQGDHKELPQLYGI